MSRFTIPVDIQSTPKESHAILEGIHKQLGSVPNIYRLVALSPAALKGFIEQANALAKGKLSPQIREGISLAIGKLNGCDYCLCAHTFISTQLLKTEKSEVEANCKADSHDPKTKAALEFAVKVAESKGRVTEQELTKLRDIGFSDAEIIEIIQNVTLNIWTNYLNNVAETAIDFPAAK